MNFSSALFNLYGKIIELYSFRISIEVSVADIKRKELSEVVVLTKALF